jgi:putative ABC transport system permease protein
MTFRNLYRQPLRSVLTVLGVAVGIVALVAFTAVVRGIWRASQRSITSGGSDLVVFQAGIAAEVFSSLEENKTRAALLSVPGVQEVAPALTHLMPVEGKPFFLLFGVHPEDFPSHQGFITEGRDLERDDEVHIGTIAQKALNKKVGDKVRLGTRTFRVVGVFQTDVVFYNGAIVMMLPALQELTKRPGQVSVFQVKVRPGAKPVEVAWRIESDHADLVAIASAQQYTKVDPGLNVFDALQVSVTILAVIVGGLVVLNTMWMSVHERTREIGVLRALGWSRRLVMGMIFCESIGVGLLACIVGSPLGLAAASLTTRWSFTHRFIQPEFDARPVVTAVIIGLVLSILGGMAPAWRAARISPAEALRYE